MGLFGPDWNSRNITKAQAAIDRLTDQTELALAARNARYVAVRCLAVGKLIDQNVIIDIARNDSSVRSSVVWNEHLVDKDVLLDIAKNDVSIDVRESAERRLEKMRKNEIAKNIEKRKIEVEKMTDSETLAVIAKTDSDALVRLAAINNRYLTDQAVFGYIATHDVDGFLRISAIHRITDAAVRDSLKPAYCEKEDHVWVPSPARDNDEAMQRHFDRISVYRCALCGKEEKRFD